MRTQISAVCACAVLLFTPHAAHSQPGPPDSSRYVDVNGARLFVRSVGSGTPLVVVHGGPGLSHDYLAPQFIALLAQEYRLVFYDQRASGRSSGREDTARLTMAQFVEDLEQLRLALGLGPVNLLGHSFGGLLAMQYASTYPQSVRTLLLLDSTPASWALNFPYFRRTIAERQGEAGRRDLEALLAPAGARADPATMTRYYRMYFRSFFHDPRLSEQLELGIDAQWLANVAVTSSRVWGDLGEYDFHDRLPRIQAPTLILHGTSSVLSMEGAEAMAARIPRSRLVRLQEVGHFPYIEAPLAFSTAVRSFVWP